MNQCKTIKGKSHKKSSASMHEPVHQAAPANSPEEQLVNLFAEIVVSTVLKKQGNKLLYQ